MQKRSLQRTGVAPVTVLCLHSSGGTGGQWNPLRAQLGPQARVLTPDLLGHGTAPAWNGVDEDIVMADAGRIIRLAETTPGDIHLVGHSYGGALALRVALHYRHKFASVTLYEPVVFRVLFDYFGRGRPASEVVEIARDMRRRLRADDVSGAAERFIDYWGGTGAWPRLASRQRNEIAKRVEVICAHFVALAIDSPLLADYRAIDAPVLMLSGAETRAPVQRVGELLRSVLPTVRYEQMPGMGHLGPLTHASAVSQRMADFIRECAFAAGAATRVRAA